MKMDEIKQIARQRNLKVGRTTKSELKRAIQRAEGNMPCFADDMAATCGQHACLWRPDCA
jgi:hypothetical protein